MKRIALVNPNWNLHNLDHTTASIRPPKSIPLELTYIAGTLKNQEVEIFDAYASNQTLETLIEGISKFKPDITILETTPTYLFWRCPPLDLSLPSKITSLIKKNTKSKVGIIGPHGTNDPHWTEEQTKADFIVRGESDFAIKRFILKKDLQGIYENHTNRGICEVDMSKLPFPAFDKLDLTRYEPHAWIPKLKKHILEDNKINFALEFSRGCIFNCSYCFMDGFRNNFRIKTNKQMELELDFVVNKGGKYIYFIDELFNRPTNELNQLLSMLKKRKLSFGHQSRPDIMSEELIEKMADSGCVYVEYGYETDDERVTTILNKNKNKDKIEKIIEKTKELIPIVNIFHINFFSPDYTTILGLPQKPVKEWDPKIVRPYPGTQLGEKIFSMYGINDKKWEFALRYTWWLQIEYKSKLVEADLSKYKKTILFGNFEQAKEKVYELLS